MGWKKRLKKIKKQNWKNKIVRFEPTEEDLKMFGEGNPPQLKDTPFKIREDYLCLGEIENMPDHFIYVDNKGKIYWGYHDDMFRLLSVEEV